MKQLFEPISLHHFTSKNRLVRSATWEGIANPDGSVTDTAYKIYEELAKGGVGTIITGFTSVSLNDYYFDGMMRLSNDSLIEQYKKLVNIIHAEHTPVLTQLALGAYYRRINRRFVQVEPDDMTADEIHQVIRQFIQAAVRAEKAGFDGVQIHAAHYFFLSRFISPAVNHRTDAYGGSVENRSRILVEILEGIRKKTEHLHISMKINSNDFSFNGLEEDQCLEICQILDQKGIDSIEISGNGTSVAGIRAHVNEGYFVDAAAQVAQAVSCPVMVVGGFRSQDVIEAVLNRTKIEMISLSRPLLREPDLPNRWKEDPSRVSQCISCNRCYSSTCHRCVFRKKAAV
ncbi:MAG: NADH:flavin oxidoreductase [Erysipelotrichaceae bacterium]|nr:NADH:flavin oxidoreductase [Erysipelotrichaceae bacterium]